MADRYVSMLDGHLAVELASSGGIGLARELAGQLAAARGGYENGLKSRSEAADIGSRHRVLHPRGEVIKPGDPTR
jgi:Rod binding domain-containing protein